VLLEPGEPVTPLPSAGAALVDDRGKGAADAPLLSQHLSVWLSVLTFAVRRLNVGNGERPFRADDFLFTKNHGTFFHPDGLSREFKSG
jgi:hypothetical protein